MGRRGRNRDMRNLIMAKLEVHEPEAFAELTELRGQNPQAYRKRLRYWVHKYPIEKPQKVMANRGAKWHAHALTEIDEALAAPFQWLRFALKHGQFDDRLEALREAEIAGENRPVVLQLIDDQVRALGPQPERPQVPPAGGDGYTRS